jgi:hypothetical protein
MLVAGWRACTRWHAAYSQLDKPVRRYCNFGLGQVLDETFIPHVGARLTGCATWLREQMRKTKDLRDLKMLTRMHLQNTKSHGKRKAYRAIKVPDTVCNWRHGCR